MEKKLKKREEIIKKNLTKPNTPEEFLKNIDDLSNIETRRRYDNKRRSKKLRVKVPA